uniref:Uncharacterized protein n=1 Tax=Capra hircus TaxID=9925 RepID=A0A8C2RN75_CAPHI
DETVRLTLYTRCRKVIPKNTHIHTQGEKLRKIILLTIDLIPFLTIHPYNLMCIKYQHFRQHSSLQVKEP